jgi:hypothetical protein
MAAGTSYLKPVEGDEAVRWADGFHAPKGVSAVAVWRSMQEAGAHSPEKLFHASKDPSHVLHEAFWSDGDEAWATRGRMEFARKVVSSLIVPHVVRNRVIEVRAVEFVRETWIPMNRIVSERHLDEAYQQDILKQAEQLHAKLARYFALKGAD